MEASDLEGKGVGAWSEMHAVSGSDSCLPRLVKDLLLSPRPCRRITTFTAWCDDAGAVTVSCRPGEKSEGSGILLRSLIRKL